MCVNSNSRNVNLNSVRKPLPSEPQNIRMCSVATNVLTEEAINHNANDCPDQNECIIKSNQIFLGSSVASWVSHRSWDPVWQTSAMCYEYWYTVLCVNAAWWGSKGYTLIFMLVPNGIPCFPHQSWVEMSEKKISKKMNKIKGLLINCSIMVLSMHGGFFSLFWRENISSLITFDWKFPTPPPLSFRRIFKWI